MYSSTYVYALWPQSFYVAIRVVFQSLKYSWQTAPYTSTTIATLSTKGTYFFFDFHFELTPFSDGQLSTVSARPTVFNWEKQCHLFTWETHEADHRLAVGQLSSPCPPSPSFRLFGAASVMLCCFPPASPSTPLRPYMYYFLEEALFINLVKVSQNCIYPYISYCCM